MCFTQLRNNPTVAEPSPTVAATAENATTAGGSQKNAGMVLKYQDTSPTE